MYVELCEDTDARHKAGKGEDGIALLKELSNIVESRFSEAEADVMMVKMTRMARVVDENEKAGKGKEKEKKDFECLEEKVALPDLHDSFPRLI